MHGLSILLYYYIVNIYYYKMEEKKNIETKTVALFSLHLVYS